MKQLFPAVFLLVILASCEKLEGGIQDTVSSPGVAAMQARARQMANIQWRPLADIPNNTGRYEKQKTYVGVPYSSVKELDKFIGFDVSFTTFLSAVRNPRSVLYTENVGKAPYNGTNCAAYYGTVCSAAVNYALGLPIPYSVSMNRSIPGFQEIVLDDLKDLREGDVLANDGHEVMVYQLERNRDSTLRKVSYLESAGTKTRIESCSAAAFQSRWNKDGWTLFRYEYLDRNTSIPWTASSVSPGAVCPDRGDACVYREGETVVIDILDGSVRDLEFFRNGESFDTKAVTGEKELFPDLPCGHYSVTASGEGLPSGEIQFDIVDTAVSARVEGGTIVIDYASETGKPEYVSLCTVSGGRLIVPFLLDGASRGTVSTPFPAGVSSCYVKVGVSTPFGRVTNAPVYLTKP